MKKIGSLVLMMIALSSFSLFAKQAVYNTGDDYDIELRYEDNPCPGDPLFVKMIINQAGKKNKVSKQEFIETRQGFSFMLPERLPAQQISIFFRRQISLSW